jgi:hypothetical protein
VYVRFWHPRRAIEGVNPGSRVQPLRVRASREAMTCTHHQVAPSVTSAVCGEPPSRMKVTVTVVSGA